MGATFCDFVRGLQFEDLPERIASIMRRSLLDVIGVAAVGTRSTESAIVTGYVKRQWVAGPAGPGARILFDGANVSPPGAAMAGAFTIDSVDAHDGHSGVKGHAGSAVLPGVLAFVEDITGQGRTFTGRDLLTALAVGYEVSYRSGLTLHATVEDYHTSGAWTAVGVAAAGARLLGLDDEGLRHAAGVAEYHGPRSQMMRCIDHPTMVRDGVGWGAPSGVSAAYLASLGFTGAPAITVEGDNARPFWEDLGERWEIENTHYKRYPVCRWAHPAIDAAARLMRDHALSSSDVDKVRIRTFDYAARLAGHEPRNGSEFAYALAFPVAAMIVRGRIGAEELAPETLDDPEILRVSRATEIVATEHYTKISVDKRWADVTLYVSDGRVLESGPCSPKGDPEDPLSDVEISDKFHELAGPVLGKARAREIEAMAAEIDRPSSDLTALLDRIYAPGRGVVRAKFQILGAAIEPLRSTRKNAGKSMAAKSGSDVLAK
jgi:2-methylcitrate dehydratase PrpD